MTALERYKIQTIDLKPDKYVHILTAEQTGGAPAQILYKKRGGSAGQLGGGSFGAVHLQDADSEVGSQPRVRAVKSISKEVARANKIHWEQEVENLIFLSRFPDLFVIIYGWWEDEKFIYLPMEYFAAGDLSNCKNSIRDEADVRTISLQIATALDKMHGMNIIHRDLKPHNVFVAHQHPDWQVKIGDFGFSKRISDSVSAPFSTRGTVKYMAPEYRDLWNDSESSDFTTAVDLWSFGCMIYELFARRCPFEEEDANSLKRYLKDKVFPREPLDRVAASNESIYLIERLLEPDPYMRWTARDALDSAWLASNATQKEALVSPVETKVARNKLSVAEYEGYQSPVTSVETAPRIGIPTSVPISRPDIARFESAPPELVVSSFEAEDGDPPPHAQLSTHPPPMSHRPASVPEHSSSALTRKAPPPLDSLDVYSKPALPPQLPARPRSISNLHDAFVAPNLERQDSLSTSTALEIIQASSVEVPRGPMRRGSSRKKNQIRRKPTPKPTPTLTSTQLPSGHITMHFRNLSFSPQTKPVCDLCEQRRIFNPVIKPAALYVCQHCDGRPLCARCIVETIKTPTDPHEADHKLQAWIQAHTFDLAETLEKGPHMVSRSTGGLPAGFGEAWVNSDHTFIAPTGGHLDTLWTMNTPPGEYTLATRFKIASQPEMVKGSSIGKHRNIMVKSKAVSLGSILLGAEALSHDDLLVLKESQKPEQHHFLPQGLKELKVKFSEEEQVETLVLADKVTVTADQKLRIHIRGSYDTEYFKAGAPFKWYLELVIISQSGPLTHIASKGDLKTREDLLLRQKKLRRERSLEKGLKYLGDGLTVATKLSGLSSSSSSKQSGLMLSAVSAGLNLGSNVMRDNRRADDGGSGGGGGGKTAPAPVVVQAGGPQNTVYNNYYVSSDAVDHGAQMIEEDYEPEYEVEEEDDDEDGGDSDGEEEQGLIENGESAE